MQPPPPRLVGQEEVHAALTEAHSLVQQGQPLQALRLVAEALRAAGLEREAGESVSRVQQALAAGSASAGAADELAGLLSLISLHQTQQQVPMVAQQQQHQQQEQQQQEQQYWQLQPPGHPAVPRQLQLPGADGGGPAAMEAEVSSGGPRPPACAASGQLAGLVAAAEGASCACPHCGGVVAAARFEVHIHSWCPALHGS